MTRRLTLRTEHLTELTPNELAEVAGGAPVTVPCPYTLGLCFVRVTRDCIASLPC